jgi:flagellar biosynthesis/type III secretory pathway protein FliH
MTLQYARIIKASPHDVATRPAADAHAVADARASVEAEYAARFLALRDAEAKLRDQSAAQIVELAVVLAERLLGQALRLEPSRIGELAGVVLEQARGARCVRIDVGPDDADGLRQALGPVERTVEIYTDPSLERGSLVVHTDLGRIDAQLKPQLARLADALREALI